MLFKSLAVVPVLLASSAAVWSVELPLPTITKLKSEEFRTREEAQRELLEWARRHPKGAMDELFRQSRVADNPEVRERCLDVLRELVNDEYLKDGEGYIGIQMMDAVVAVPGDPAPRSGIRVMQVVPDSAAERAGLRQNDLIVELDKQIWRDGPVLLLFAEKIRGMKPGSQIVLKILRDGKLEDLRVTLGRRPLIPDQAFLDNRAVDLEAAERAAREAYFQRWMEERRAREPE